ncbi:MAG TPA: hypothetical protein ENK43_17140 [Planctomycetes bacterium]|nr:hypothetical protein [Planctomycetota bacterium]
MDDMPELETPAPAGEAQAGRIRPPVRVLYVLDRTPRDRPTMDLVKRLGRLGRMQFHAAAVVLEPHGPGTEKIQGKNVRVVSLEARDQAGVSGFAADVKAILGLRSVVAKFDPDVVHAIGPRSLVIVGLAQTSFPRIPVVIEGIEAGRNRGFRGIFEKLARRSLTAPVIAQTDGDAWDRPWLAWAPEDARIQMGHGIDLAAARSAPLLGPEELPLERRYLGLVLNPGETSALRPMLEAFRVVAADEPDLDLIVLTEGAAICSARWEEDLGLRGRILFREPPAEWASLVRRLEVLWVHGRPRPSQRAILEGMVVGVPVVCDHTTGLRPRIETLGGALMRDGQWPRQFAEATRELLESDPLRTSVGAAGKKLVEMEFPMAAHAERWRDLYEKLTCVSPPPNPG